MANGSLSSNTSGEGEIRQHIVEADLVDAIVALPAQLFYTTGIPVCLWFLTRDKTGRNLKSGGRDRKGDTLFIDARKLGTMQTRTLRVLSGGDDDETLLAGGLGDPRADVLEIREVIRRLQLGETDRRIARDLQVSRKAVSKYRTWAQARQLLTGALPDPEALQALLSTTVPIAVPPTIPSKVTPYRDQVIALRARDVECRAILDILREHIEAQFWQNEEFRYSRRFDTRALAVQWAKETACWGALDLARSAGPSAHGILDISINSGVSRRLASGTTVISVAA